MDFYMYVAIVFRYLYFRFSRGTRWVSPSPQDTRLHLARSGSQSQRSIWFILPAHGASHIIMG